MSESDALEHLKAKIEWLELRLAAHAAARLGEDVVDVSRRAAAVAQRVARLEREGASPVRHLRDAHGLDDFEIDTLYLAVGARLDFHLAELVQSAPPQGGGYVSPWLVLGLFAETRLERLQRMRALDDDGRLLRTGLLRCVEHPPAGGNPQLVELVPADMLCSFVRGRRAVGAALQGIARPVIPQRAWASLALPERDLDGLAGVVRQLDRPTPLPEQWHDPGDLDFPRGLCVLVTGERGAGKTLVARALAREAGVQALEIDGGTLAARPPAEIPPLLEAAFVEAAFFGEWLIIDQAERVFHQAQDDLPLPDRSAEGSVAALLRCLSRFPVTVVLSAEQIERVAEGLHDRFAARYQLPPMDSGRLARVWETNLPPAPRPLDDAALRPLAEAHPMSGRAVQTAVAVATRTGGRSPRSRLEALSRAAALQSGAAVSRMAQRVWIRRSFDDLLLPQEVSTQIQDIIETERVRERVLRDWGLERTLQKGLGQVCLFDGPPGTGKTLSAEVIASELGLPLYAVSIAHVVSKYIGETEKNLQRIFDDATRSRCLVLFDEADTLFSKRTEASNAVSRYANMEVGLLLQLVEGYRGLVVLTTNLKDALDPAFNRRFSHKVSFGFPDAPVRLRIWERLLPAERLGPDIDLEELAEVYELSGGSIRTCVLRASLRAACRGRALGRAELIRAAREELRSVGKLVRDEVED